MRVIVTNCFSRVGMAAINALAGSHEVIGGMYDRQALQSLRYERWLRSKALADVFRHPPPERDLQGFSEAIVDACRRYDAHAVMPTSTGLAIALSLAKRSAPPDLKAAFVIEDWDKLAAFADKWHAFELCRELDIPTPRTVLPVGDGVAELDELAFPVVAKPRVAEAARGVEFFDERSKLDEFLAAPPNVGVAPDDEYPYIVQEFVPGLIHDAGCCTYAGRPVTLYSQQRVVTVFEFGGPSVTVQLTDEPETRAHAARMLEHLGWNGFVVFEFIRTPAGEYVFLEGNPRFGAALQLIVEAGMNICAQSLEIFALGTEPPATLSYPVGMACKWYSPAAVKLCFREPRTPAAIIERVRSVFGRYEPGPTVTNLQPRDLRHLAGVVVDGLAAKRATARRAVAAKHAAAAER